MEIGERFSGLMLVLTGAAMLVTNDLYMIYFNSMPDFSVSGGGLITIVGLAVIIAGIALITTTARN